MPRWFFLFLRNTISVGDATIGAAQFSAVQQSIEGFNIADLGWGTANAKTVTLSFWVRSSVTGQYVLNLRNADDTRINPSNYTVNSANTWEYKTITVVGDTGGTWNSTNGIGIQIAFYAALGSNFIGGTANTWGAAPNYGCGTPVNGIASNGNIFAITGVQLEVGTQATTFTLAGGSYGAELQLCQRYYTNNFYGTLVNFWQSSLVGTWPRFPVPMRASPTVNLSSGSNISIDIFGVGGSTFPITSADTLSSYGCRIFGTPAAPQPSGYIGHISSYNIQASAEL